MKEYAVPGLSIAIARKGRLVYQQGFGLADVGNGEKVTPAHRFRIGSISKSITSVAIFTLIEQGRIDTRPWITHRTPFDDLIEVFPSYTKPETGVVKAIVEL